MKKVEVEITGICPLLQNRFPIEDFGINESKAKRKVVDVNETVNKALYKTKDGKLYHPAEHLFQAMRRAASNFKFEGKKTYKDVIMTGIVVTPEEIPMINDKYEIDVRPVVTGSGGRILSYRPMFRDWKLKFIIEVLDSDNIALPVLKEILESAGATKGIGDYRPRFGRFMVTSFQEVTS